MDAEELKCPRTLLGRCAGTDGLDAACLHILVNSLDLLGREEARPGRHSLCLPADHAYGEELAFRHAARERGAQVRGVRSADRVRAMAAEAIGIEVLEAMEHRRRDLGGAVDEDREIGRD